jgi:hypothetical protein
MIVYDGGMVCTIHSYTMHYHPIHYALPLIHYTLYTTTHTLYTIHYHPCTIIFFQTDCAAGQRVYRAYPTQRIYQRMY